MATRMVWDLWVPFASICMMFAMLVAVGVSEPSWTYVHSDTPASSPNTGTGEVAQQLLNSLLIFLPQHYLRS